MKTYRYRGHSMSDPAKYRQKEEVEDYKMKDPIEQVRKTILDNKWMNEKDFEEMEDDIVNQVNKAVEFAENSDYPSPDELYTDVYEEEYPFIIE
jgi:pyruvate dehydrogenase E1 component alpha subunit